MSSTQHAGNQNQDSKAGASVKPHRPIIVGLDIGTTKVVAIAGRKDDNDKIEVLGWGRADSVGVGHGVVINIEDCIRSIGKAMTACFESNPNLDIREVYVGIAGKHIKSLQTRGDRVRANTDDEISKEDIDQLFKDQYKTYIPASDQIIDVIAQYFIVDNSPYVMKPIGMSGVKIGANFHLITGDKQAIRNITKCVDKSNLIAKDLVLQPLASAMAVVTEEDLEAGVAIVDIGGGTTDMAVFYDGILRHTAVIPYAGVNITEDIRLGLGVLKAQAEQLKIQFGTALATEANPSAYIAVPGLRGLSQKEISVKTLGQIIEARMDEILESVAMELRRIDLDKRLHGGIILTGGGSRLKNLVQLTNFRTGLHARLGLPNEHLAPGYDEKLSDPAFATCIGLILRGYHDFETGKHQFSAIHNGFIAPVPQQQQTPTTAPSIAQPAAKQPVPQLVAEPEPEKEVVQGKKTGEKMSAMLQTLKGKFMELFGDEDTKME
jgi:cell division protein FtsA